MKAAFKRWWEGEYVPYENEPNLGFVIIAGDTKRHWTAMFARVVWGFFCKEWKWAIGTILAVVGLSMTYVRFF
jgi:hypothetical protein